MKYVIDCHTHTIVSGHAYTTLLENIKEASKKGIKVLGSTEHGPEMPGGPHLFYFSNFKVIPREVCGVKVLRGCEANILDSKGNLDIPERILQKLDIVIASLHDVCIEPASIDKNTEALLNVMDNPYIHIIGHPGNPMFPIHAEEVVKKAVEKNILIEINNSSFLGSRVGSKENCKDIAILCKKYGAKVIINSDSHISYSIGDFKVADEMFKEIQMPEELIINTDENKIISFLHSKGKVLDIELD